MSMLLHSLPHQRKLTEGPPPLPQDTRDGGRSLMVLCWVVSPLSLRFPCRILYKHEDVNTQQKILRGPLFPKFHYQVYLMYLTSSFFFVKTELFWKAPPSCCFQSLRKLLLQAAHPRLFPQKYRTSQFPSVFTQTACSASERGIRKLEKKRRKRWNWGGGCWVEDPCACACVCVCWETDQ